MTTLPKTPARSRRRARFLTTAYLTAREFVVDAGFGREIDWQDARDFCRLGERDFLQEAAWVVLSTGMADSVVRRVFSDVSEAFLGWRSAVDIVIHQEQCVEHAERAFRNKRKLRAIVFIAESVVAVGFDAFKAQLEIGGPAALRDLDFIGPVTCFHLAKNIGLDFVKPDRHLMRAAAAARVNDPSELCHAIAGLTGDRLATIDLVFWRYGALRRDFEGLFATV